MQQARKGSVLVRLPPPPPGYTGLTGCAAGASRAIVQHVHCAFCTPEVEERQQLQAVASQQLLVQREVAGACVPTVTVYKHDLEKLPGAPECLQGFSLREKKV